MTWEIVVGLIALVGAVISIGAVISSNTKALTEVKCAIEAVNKNMTAQQNEIHELKHENDLIKKEIAIVNSDIMLLRETRPYCDKKCCERSDKK